MKIDIEALKQKKALESQKEEETKTESTFAEKPLKTEISVQKEEVREEPKTENVKHIDRTHVTFEDQYKNSSENVKMIIDNIIKMEGMEYRIKHSKGTVQDMLNYIQKKAHEVARNGMAMVDDQTVFGWGRDYYDEQDLSEDCK